MNDDDQPGQRSCERASQDVDEGPRHGDMNDDSRAPPESQKQQDCMLYTVVHKAADTVCDDSCFTSNVHTEMTYDDGERKCLVNYNDEHTRMSTTDSIVECRNSLDFPTQERGKMACERSQACVRSDERGARHRNNCDAGDCRSFGRSALDECDSGRRVEHASDSSQTAAHGGAASHRFDDASNPCDDMENYFRINAHLLDDDDADTSTGRETGNTLGCNEEHSTSAVDNCNVGNGNKSVRAKDDENGIASGASMLANTSSDSGGCCCNLEETVESASNGESCDSCRKFSHELDVVLCDRNCPNDLDAERPNDVNRGAHRNVQDSYPAFVGVADNLQEQMTDLGFEDEFPDAVPQYQNVATSQNSDSGAEHDDFIDVDISKHVYADFDSISCGSNSVHSSSSNEDLSLNAAVDSNIGNSSSTAVHYSHSDDRPETPTPDAYSTAVSSILDAHCGCDSGEFAERPSRLPGLVKSSGIDTRGVPSTESDSTSQSESSCYLTLSSSSSLHSPLCVDCDHAIGVATSGLSVNIPQGGVVENIARQRGTDQLPLDDTSVEREQACHAESSDRRNRTSGTLPMQTRHCPCRRRDGTAKKITWPTKVPQQFVRSFSADTISSYAQAGHMTARTMLGGEPCRSDARNNLNVDRENICNHDREDMFNVSRQTSTDQDEDNVHPAEDSASRRRRCPHFKDSVVEPPHGDDREERRNDCGVDRRHHTQDSCIECAHGKESETESRSCVYCNIHSPDPDFQHHARGRMRESCSDTDLTFSATAPHARVDATRQLSLDRPDIPRLQVVYREQMITNGHQRHTSSCCDEEIKNNLQ